MTVGMEQDQVRSSIMLVVAIPVRQFEGFLGLDDLSADRTASCLLVQEVRTKRRGRLQRQLSIPRLAIGFPVRVEGVGVVLDLDVTLGFDRFVYPDALFAGRWISKAPCVPWLMGQVARSDPAPGVVWVAKFGPPIQPSPHEAVELGKRLATDDVAVLVRPAPEDGGQRIDELCRCSACGLLTERFDFGGDGLNTRLAGSNLQLGRFAVWSGMFTDRLPYKVKALSEGGHDRFVRG